MASPQRNLPRPGALISEMDLIISIDTSVAHLAWALGKRLWVLLPFHPDFRWLRHRGDSPWYPTAKLFRQASDGDWNGVLRRVSSALKTILPALQANGQD
jgi:ADP-heptose:LPS heptosyltransferase